LHNSDDVLITADYIKVDSQPDFFSSFLLMNLKLLYEAIDKQKHFFAKFAAVSTFPNKK
jgi:hypothetical protein